MILYHTQLWFATIMFEKIEKMLMHFRTCFSREKAFEWFVIIVIGIILRTDLLGLTSVIRSMMIPGTSYTAMMAFFRASSWNLTDLRKKHCRVVKKHIPGLRKNNRCILVGDGSKGSKEGKYMPGVKKYKQESETQSKPEMIFGHLWGCIGLLTIINGQISCTPMTNKIHDGLQGMEKWDAWEDHDFSVDSHVVQILRDACNVADYLEDDATLLLDRYYLSRPALLTLDEHNKQEHRKSYVHMIVKARRTTTGYKQLPKEKDEVPKKGRPRKKGDKVVLWDLFETEVPNFRKTTIRLYGRRREVSYYCIDLLWHPRLLRKLRFVLSVLDTGEKSIFATTDLSMHPVDVIRHYSYRQLIETGFRAMKQNVGSFAYHFWTKALPELNRFKKKEEQSSLYKVTNKKDQKRILDTIEATEMFMLLSMTAVSILHALTVFTRDPAIRKKLRYQRTPATVRPSEDNMMVLLRSIFWRMIEKHPQSPITTIIKRKQKNIWNDIDLFAA